MQPPSVHLLDLDSDTLLCIARHVSPDDWLPVAMTCRSLDSACRLAYMEQHASSQLVKWRTSASVSENRLNWAVDCVGYEPDQQTLRDIAFRGDASLFRKVWTKWRPSMGLPKRAPLMYPIFRHAGASGNADMIDEVVKWMPTDDLDDTRKESVEEVLIGMVTYDRVDMFLVRWIEMTDRDYDVLLNLVHTSIEAGSEKMMSLLLDVLDTFPDSVTRGDVIRWFHDAVFSGRASMLKCIFERYACGADKVVNDVIWHGQLIMKAFPKQEDEALQSWTALDFYEKDFKPVDHLATFRVMCETMRIPVPECVIDAAMFSSRDTEAIEYIHLHHWPVHIWTKSPWLTALTRIDDDDLRVATFAYDLGQNLSLCAELMTGTIINMRHSGSNPDQAAEPTILRLDWLRKRNVPWFDSTTDFERTLCVKLAIRYGSTTLLRWMLENGASMRKDNVLMDTLSVFESDMPNDADRFRETVSFLLDECGSSVPFLFLPILTEFTNDVKLPLWLVTEKGAPFQENLFWDSPVKFRLRRLVSLRQR